MVVTGFDYPHLRTHALMYSRRSSAIHGWGSVDARFDRRFFELSEDETFSMESINRLSEQALVKPSIAFFVSI